MQVSSVNLFFVVVIFRSIDQFIVIEGLGCVTIFNTCRAVHLLVFIIQSIEHFRMSLTVGFKRN
jgi:hypothetical protein